MLTRIYIHCPSPPIKQRLHSTPLFSSPPSLPIQIPQRGQTCWQTGYGYELNLHHHALPLRLPRRHPHLLERLRALPGEIRRCMRRGFLLLLLLLL